MVRGAHDTWHDWDVVASDILAPAKCFVFFNFSLIILSSLIASSFDSSDDSSFEIRLISFILASGLSRSAESINAHKLLTKFDSKSSTTDFYGFNLF